MCVTVSACVFIYVYAFMCMYVCVCVFVRTCVCVGEEGSYWGEALTHVWAGALSPQHATHSPPPPPPPPPPETLN